jgi:hypothetical protein
MRWRLLALAAGFTGLAASCDEDPVVETFNTAMTGANEVPAVVTTATGTATVTLSEGVLTFNVTANGLSGPVNAAHIHVGAAGQEGPPVFTFTHTAVATGTVASGTIVGTTGLTITRDSLIVLLRNGNSYVNLHTVANPDGEVRGQLN